MKSCFIDARILLIAIIFQIACNETSSQPVVLEEPPEIGRMCTMIGCEDGATVTILTADGKRLTSDVEVMVDGEIVVCHPPQNNMADIISIQCSSSKVVTIERLRPDCERFELANNELVQCLGGRSRFMMAVTYRGTPAQMTLRLTKHGKIIEERALSFSEYHVSQPNGPGCDPICRHAEKAWVLPPSPQG